MANSSLDRLLSQLETEKANGGIDKGMYDYLKNQYVTADQKYNNELDTNYNEYKNTNAFSTDRAKEIMKNYQAQGYEKASNEIASGAAENGGNLDSFAASNALRQQLSFTNEGAKMVLQENETRQDRLLNYLDRMKANAEGYYAKTDKLATDDLNFKTTIGGRIANVYGQINANEQAERDRQAAAALQAQQAASEMERSKYQLKAAGYDDKRSAALPGVGSAVYLGAKSMQNEVPEKVSWGDQLSTSYVPEDLDGAGLTKGGRKFAYYVLGNQYKGKQISNQEYKDLILKYTQDYDVEQRDAQNMANALGLDSKWLDDYGNKGLGTWSFGAKGLQGIQKKNGYGGPIIW